MKQPPLATRIRPQSLKRSSLMPIKFNYANHHQLFRLLNLMGINEERFKELLNNA